MAARQVQLVRQVAVIPCAATSGRLNAADTRVLLKVDTDWQKGRREKRHFLSKPLSGNLVHCVLEARSIYVCYTLPGKKYLTGHKQKHTEHESNKQAEMTRLI
ncbi:hypothetical protein AMECASPLE_035690 [Ameca splendens]|uniref:Uncharacterized protein n=1 Tax=Ameca splendens TaxID=208324 RepID=A0ABV0ZSE0_9TELE